MSAEREVLLSILRMTKGGDAEVEDISKETAIPRHIVSEVVRRNSETSLVKVLGETVVVDGERRLRTAIRAMELGADVERVCRLLTWTEFEDISIFALEANGFTVKKHFRFSWSGRRWEIDVLGLKKPLVTSMDCKHWHRPLSKSASKKVAEQQVNRTKALTEAAPLEKIGIKDWKNALFIPIVLSLMPSALTFYERTPIVPVLQLQTFLQDMPAYMHTMFYIRKDLSIS